MNLGWSSLNPYAASDIPLSKRDLDDRTYMAERGSKSSNEATHFATSEQIRHNQPLSGTSSYPKAHGTQVPEMNLSTSEIHPSQGSCDSLLQSENSEKDEENLNDLDVDMEYLRLTFPGVSHASLVGGYIANKGDLNASVDMLSQLEIYTVDTKSLPDTLNICNVSASRSSNNEKVSADSST